MALNEMIAQGAQFKMPDPLEQYGRIAQIQQAQNQNALAQYQISSAQRADETNTNFLGALRAAGNDPMKIQQAYINAGKGKEASEYATSLLTQQKTRGDVQEQLRKDFTFRLQDLSNNPSDANVTANAEDIANDANYPDPFKKVAARKFAELLAMPVEDRAKLLAMSGMSGAERATANRPLASGGNLYDVTGKLIGQGPEPGYNLNPGQTHYPRGYMGAGVVTAPAAAPAAVKSPDKITIMTALGYPLTPAGNEAYETAIRAKPTVAALSGEIGTMTSLGIPITTGGYAYFQELKTKTPVAAPQALTTEERNARAIALGAGPEGSDAFNAALRTEISRMTAKPVAAAARDDSSPDIKNMRALGIPETTAGFAYYNELKTKTPVAAAPAPTEAMKNAASFARAKGEEGTPAYNKEFAARMEKFTAKKEGGEGGGAAKAPSGFRFTPTGDLEAIPGGPAAGKPLTALQQQAIKKDFAADTSKIKAAVDTADELEKLTDDLVGNTNKKIKPHPGLSGITGYQGLLPSFAASPVTSGNAAKAEQKLDTFKGKIKTLGRSLASLDGKLGNMAVQEWQFISDAVQNIKPTAGNLDEQMRDVVRQARLLAKNLRDKFDLTYEDKTTAAAAPSRPAPAAAGGVVDFGSLR